MECDADRRFNTVFLALTRPTCVLGVGVDYLFFLIVLVFSLFLLFNDPRVLFLSIPLWLFGRWCYYSDSALLTIFLSRARYLNQSSKHSLGVFYYDPF